MPRIRTVDGFHFSYRLPKSEQKQWQGGVIAKRDVILVRIRTADGRIGWGEIGEGYFFPELYVTLLTQKVREFLVGRESRDPEAIHDQLRVFLVSLGSTGLARAVLSGIDLALHNLWSPTNPTPFAVPVYASTGFHPDRGRMIEECQRAVEMGFTVLKIRGGFSVPEDIQRVKRARRHLGVATGLILELGQPYSLRPYSYQEVERLCMAIRDEGTLWVEEPFWPEDIQSYHRLKTRGLVRVGAGENLYTEEQFRTFAKVLDVCQPDITRMGGVTTLNRIARSCRTLAPHQFGASVALVTVCRAVQHFRNLHSIELDLLTNPFREKIFGKNCCVIDGKLMVPPYDLQDFAPHI